MKMSRLVEGFDLLQVLKAFSDEAIAFWTSSSVAEEHFQQVLLSIGEITSKVELVVTCLPSRKSGTVEEESKAAWALPLEAPFVVAAILIFLEFRMLEWSIVLDLTIT